MTVYYLVDKLYLFLKTPLGKTSSGGYTVDKGIKYIVDYWRYAYILRYMIEIILVNLSCV